MEPLKVLFVDDDTDLGHIINMGLAKLGYKVHFQNSLLAIDEVIAQFSPAIIVLDVEIGDDNGIEKARDITQKFPTIPILFVSSHADISYITEGLEVGGVNYLKKPFDIEELAVYIDRFARKENPTNIIAIGNYLFNMQTNELCYEQEAIKQLSPMERNALLLFWDNMNRTVSLNTLSLNLWGEKYSVERETSIYNLISKLRKLLSKDNRVSIKTITGEGYQLCVL